MPDFPLKNEESISKTKSGKGTGSVAQVIDICLASAKP
jgi:hypothetical protein